MDMNIDEQWLELSRFNTNNRSISAVSNTGKFRRVDGTEGILGLRQIISTKCGRIRAHRIIAEHFLITVKRPDQNQIDHITHYPTEYHVNNVLNLRWCTNRENSNFDEARANKSVYTGEMANRWKGESIGAYQRYNRALKEYRRNPTEENLAALKEARLIRREYLRHLRDKKLRQEFPIDGLVTISPASSTVCG